MSDRKRTISTWNINGLRSAIDKGLREWLELARPDIVCFQEIKMQSDLFLGHLFPEYEVKISDSIRKGYSGVATLVKKNIKILSQDFLVNDYLITSEGRVLFVELDDMCICNVYVPHSHRSLKRLEYKLFFMQKLMDALDARIELNKPIILVGDFNVAHTEMDLTNDKTNKNNAGFLDVERSAFTDLLNRGFVDAFRMMTNGKGYYTWWGMMNNLRARNIGWRLDYILVNKDFSSAVINCWHLPEVFGSDHCPVMLEIVI